MIHQYKLNGYNIVLDICSGAVHAVDEVAYDIIALFETKTKEEIVAVLGIFEFTDMSALAGFSFLIFNLLCAPCVAAMGAIKREMNSGKWTLFAIGYQCALAYAVSFCIYQIGSFFTALSANTLTAGPVVGALVSLGIIIFALYMIFRPYKEKEAAKLD